MMLICCESCWMCCAPCSMKCTCEDKIERVRHPDTSWTCNRLLRKVDSRDAVRHALHELTERMGKDVPDGGKMPEGYQFVRTMLYVDYCIHGWGEDGLCVLCNAPKPKEE